MVVTMRRKHRALLVGGCACLLSYAAMAQDDTITSSHSRVYDANGRLITDADANNKPTDYAYDPNGNLIAMTAARGIKTRMTYDARNRLKTIT